MTNAEMQAEKEGLAVELHKEGDKYGKHICHENCDFYRDALLSLSLVSVHSDACPSARQIILKAFRIHVDLYNF